MSEKNFVIYLEFGYSKLNIASFDSTSGKLKYFKEELYKSHFGYTKELNFDQLNNFVEENIHKTEKSVGKFINDIYLMVETPQSLTVKLSVMKNNEGKIMTKENAMYLIQDGKQQLLKSNSDIQILHMIVENYVLDDENYNFLPLDINCKKFSMDLKFICFPKDLIKKFEQLFLRQQISIKQFICSNYVKNSNFKNDEKNICERGKAIVEGINKQEVVIVPKIIKKSGFFERLFHFFK